MKRDKSAIVFNLSVDINALANRKSIKPKAIGESCYKNVYVYKEISTQSKGCTRADIDRFVSQWN